MPTETNIFAMVSGALDSLNKIIRFFDNNGNLFKSVTTRKTNGQWDNLSVVLTGYNTSNKITSVKSNGWMNGQLMPNMQTDYLFNVQNEISKVIRLSNYDTLNQLFRKEDQRTFIYNNYSLIAMYAIGALGNVKPTSKVVYNLVAGHIDSERTYQWDSVNLLYGPKFTSRKFQYNSNGIIIGYLQYNTNGNLQSTMTYTRDANDKLLRSDLNAQSYIIARRYELNPFGYPLLDSAYFLNPNTQAITNLNVNRYTYEDYDNLIIHELTNQITEAVIYPNPSTEGAQIFWNMQNPAALQVAVSNLNGSIIFTEKYNAHKGQNRFHIPCGQWPTGLYIVQIKGQGCAPMYKKMTKQ